MGWKNFGLVAQKILEHVLMQRSGEHIPKRMDVPVPNADARDRGGKTI